MKEVGNLVPKTLFSGMVSVDSWNPPTASRTQETHFLILISKGTMDDMFPLLPESHFYFSIH